MRAQSSITNINPHLGARGSVFNPPFLDLISDIIGAKSLYKDQGDL